MNAFVNLLFKYLFKQKLRDISFAKMCSDHWAVMHFSPYNTSSVILPIGIQFLRDYCYLSDEDFALYLVKVMTSSVVSPICLL